MFWISLIVILGGSYLYYRFNTISNKNIFYQSPLVLSIAGSTAILFAAVTFVNCVAPVHVQELQITTKDTLSAEEKNTTLSHLLHKDVSFHYALITKLNENSTYVDQLDIIKKRYRQFLKQSDPRIVSLGNYCLGVIALKGNDIDEARRKFARVTDHNLPRFHLSLGELYMAENKLTDAARQFKLELNLANGDVTNAFVELLHLYESSENYAGLRELLDYEPAYTLFPEELARITLLNTGDVIYYLVWVYHSIANNASAAGLIAAFAISLIWLIYLLRLDVFGSNKVIPTLLMFIAGMLSVSMMTAFNDLHDIMIAWSLNGEFMNDLIYCISMIGIPEEFVKIYPLLMLLMLGGAPKEPIDYIIYGSASALGFAFIENLLYFDEITDGIIHGRAYFAVIGHMVNSSFAAYGFVVTKFKLDQKAIRWYVIPLSFLMACVAHGIYDFLIFHQYTFLFFIFFIFVIQFWIIIINNALNNSPGFSYRKASRVESSKVYIALALTTIFALEYIFSGFFAGAEQANTEMYSNLTFAGFLIVFFASNLSSFDLVKGYWRAVYFSSREKRGYGSRQATSLLVSWYFVNSIKSHNYVGLKIRLRNDPYNKMLGELLQGDHEGQIVNRLMLYEKSEADPHWFVVKLSQPIPFAEASQEYVLVKLRYQEDSLLYEDEVQVFIKAITDSKELRTARPLKERFPFYGWAQISLA